MKVPFSVDRYVDKVECDVLPLHVCHLLLGRPWQHDVNALHHGRTNRYTFMHKGEFYAFLPKDAKNIKCTVEVFKKKSARCRLKPRTVSLQGREDDAASPTNNISSLKKYVIPAKRKTRKKQPTCVYDEAATSTSIEDVPIQLIALEKVKPNFRTPCSYIMVGSIQVKLA